MSHRRRELVENASKLPSTKVDVWLGASFRQDSLQDTMRARAFFPNFNLCRAACGQCRR
jgi:hypothetical protein